MRILLVTFYFSPDLCAGSFRNTALVEALKQYINSNDTIDVITTMPNRYYSFKPEANGVEKYGNIRIHRIKIPTHKSGYVDQILSFRAFYSEALRLVRNKRYDIVCASSSRLFTAFLGARIARKKGSLLYLDIRDIFADTMNDVLSKSILRVLTKPVLERIEHYTITTASSLNLVSKGFEPYFKRYYTGKTTFFTNGIDEEFMGIEVHKEATNGKPKIITYAGNIGEGQGLDRIIPEAAKILEGFYHFKVIGDGSARSKLADKIKKLNVQNVELINPIKRDELPGVYAQSDFLFLHLNDYDAFLKVLPSKIFEYGATPLPVIAGVNGYARTFIKENLENAIVFDPNDVSDFIQKLNDFIPEYKVRHEFINKFQRSNIMREMAKSIVHMGREEEVTVPLNLKEQVQKLTRRRLTRISG